MNFIYVNDVLINLDNIDTIWLSGYKLMFSKASGQRGEYTYETEDAAKIAFSELKLEIDRLQNICSKK